MEQTKIEKGTISTETIKPLAELKPKKPSFLKKILGIVWTSCSSCAFFIVLMQLFCIFLVIFVVAKSGIIHIPILSDQLNLPSEHNLQTEVFLPPAQEVGQITDKINQKISENPENFTLELKQDEVNTLLQEVPYSEMGIEKIYLTFEDDKINLYLSISRPIRAEVNLKAMFSIDRNQISLNFIEGKIGNLNLPVSVINLFSETLMQQVRNVLNQNQELDIKSLTVQNNLLIIKGSLKHSSEEKTGNDYDSKKTEGGI